MSITAAQVKELRERTGAGMMECKKALVETQGDLEAAIELMRKSGQAKAAKKAGRIAAEGVIVVRSSADGATLGLVEVNCETDFVAKDEGFRGFADAVAECVLAGSAASVEELSASPLRSAAPMTVNEAREALISKLGENIAVRRFERLTTATGHLYSYSHGTRIGVVVELEGGDEALGRDLAMHIAASNPLCVAPEQVSADVVDKEREIALAQATAQAAETGKPQSIVDKMVEGRIRKFLGEITLLGQPFVKDPSLSVGQLLKQKGARVLQFRRLEVGEGIEKKKENFAEEVAAQVRGA
jgi:elongation factor Ts